MTMWSPTRAPRSKPSISWSRTGPRSSRSKASRWPRRKAAAQTNDLPGRGPGEIFPILTDAADTLQNTMTAIIHPDTGAGRIGEQVRFKAPKRVRGLSDRGIAWLFVAPTIALLLAINIFPLIWMIRLSFTSLNLSMSYLPTRFVGLDNYSDILTDEDVWTRLQTTASFVIWSVALQVVIGFGLALLINRQFRSHSFWTTIILLPMMLSPAVVGNFWTLLFQPQIGPF